MPLPEALQGEKWTRKTARTILPLLIWCAKNGRAITYGQLDDEVVSRGLGHHVMVVQYGYPAGAVGNALIETGEEWGEAIPPLNALVVNKKHNLPGDGVNWFLDQYYEPKKCTDEMTIDEKRAIVEEIHADIFSYEYWDELLEEYEIGAFEGTIVFDDDENENISSPSKGGWSDEAESEEHKKLKEYISQNPKLIGLNKDTKNGEIEYLFSSADKADIVFKNIHKYTAVEVKSIKSNDNDLNRGIFQCIKYQALLRAEQKALLIPPTARAILITERRLPISLQNLADTLGIKVIVCKINT